MTTEGELKCPNGCTAGSPEATACQAKAAVDTLGWAKRDKRFGSVPNWADRFRSLKSDPDRVIVAAIAGDSTAKDATQRHKERVRFWRGQLKDQGPGQAPYICSSERGEANHGSRFVALTKAFGDRGIFANLCSNDTLDVPMVAIAEKVASLLKE